jgi:hypothetical protein
MSTPRAESNEEINIDDASLKGWAFFTKFLLWNVIAIIASLLIIGLLTVWR